MCGSDDGDGQHCHYIAAKKEDLLRTVQEWIAI